MIRKRDTIILALIATLFVLLSLSVRSQSEYSVAHKIRTLLDESLFHFDNVQRIELHRSGVYLDFERIEGVWWQQKPFSVRMDPFSMKVLIETIHGLQLLGELDDMPPLDVLGLDEGANKIVIFDGETTISVRLGRKTLGGRAYAMLDGGEPVLVDQSLHRRAIDMDHRWWRDIRLFASFAIDGDRIEREVDGVRLLLERSDGLWEMREPVSARVDQELLMQWVGQLAGARVGSFVVDQPSNLSLFGLEAPTAYFAVGDRQGVTHKLFIGGRVSAGSQDRYVMLEDRPVVFSMRWEMISQFFPIPELLVDGRASGVSRFDAKRITIRSSDHEVTLQRELDRWVNVSRGSIPVDRVTVDALLHWVLDAKPTSVGFGSYPQDLEVCTITFEGYDLIPLDTVRVARKEDGTWILENGDNVLRIHPSEAGDVLSPFMK